jgi:ethanolamine transporter EutH
MGYTSSADQQLVKIRDSVALVGRLSDGLLRLGPLSLGLDGILSWVPGLGEVYSTVAGAFILIQGARAGVPVSTLALAGGLMLSRTAVSAIPLAGPMAADLFTAHRWSARLIVGAIDREIDRQTPVQPRRSGVREAGRFAAWYGEAP